MTGYDEGTLLSSSNESFSTNVRNYSEDFEICGCDGAFDGVDSGLGDGDI